VTQYWSIPANDPRNLAPFCGGATATAASPSRHFVLLVRLYARVERSDSSLSLQGVTGNLRQPATNCNTDLLTSVSFVIDIILITTAYSGRTISLEIIGISKEFFVTFGFSIPETRNFPRMILVVKPGNIN